MSLELIIIILATLVLVLVSYALGRLIFLVLGIELTSFLGATLPVIGLVSMALQLWLFGFLNIPWNTFTLLLPWLLLALLLLRQGKLNRGTLDFEQKIPSEIRGAMSSHDLLSKSLLVVAVVCMVAFLIMLTLRPFTTSDILGFWGYKAKEFFVNQEVYINPYLRSTPELARYHHVDYPPLWPLMADVTYVLFGRINEALFRTTQFVFVLSGFTSMYVFARKYLPKKLLPIGVDLSFVLLMAPQYLRMLFEVNYMGYADYPLAILMLLSVLFFVKGIVKPLGAEWWLSIALAAAAASTKNEGLPFFAIMLAVNITALAEQMVQSRIKIQIGNIVLTLLGLVAVALPVLAWSYFKASQHIEVDFSLNNISASDHTVLRRLYDIFALIWLYIRTNPPYQWQGIGIVLALLATLVYKGRTTIMLCSILLLQLLSYVVSYVLSPYDLEFHVLSSIDRLSAQVLPIILVLLIVVVAHANQPQKKLQ